MIKLRVFVLRKINCLYIAESISYLGGHPNSHDNGRSAECPTGGMALEEGRESIGNSERKQLLETK